MSQHYSDPEKEDPYALSGIKVFHQAPACGKHGGPELPANGSCHECAMLCGWYWWSCFPDSEAFGPFATKAEALADAQSDS